MFLLFAQDLLHAVILLLDPRFLMYGSLGGLGLGGGQRRCLDFEVLVSSVGAHHSPSSLLHGRQEIL